MFGEENISCQEMSSTNMVLLCRLLLPSGSPTIRFQIRPSIMSTVGPRCASIKLDLPMVLEPNRPEPNLWASHPVHRSKTWPATANMRR